MHFKAFNRSDYRFRTALLWVIFSTSLLATYSLISWLPTLLGSAGWSRSDAQRAAGVLALPIPDPARALEDDNLHGRIAHGRPDRADGPMTGEWFAAYAQQVLAPTLRPGDIVVLDNLPAHKVAAAREAIEAVGARMLFLPPCSPDFNPIENAFSKLKSILRKAAARTVPELWDAIRDALPRFTPNECTNYFIAAGYEPE